MQQQYATEVAREKVLRESVSHYQKIVGVMSEENEELKQEVAKQVVSRDQLDKLYRALYKKGNSELEVLRSSERDISQEMSQELQKKLMDVKQQMMERGKENEKLIQENETLQRHISQLKEKSHQQDKRTLRLFETKEAEASKLREKLSKQKSKSQTKQTNWQTLEQQYLDKLDTCDDLRGKMRDYENVFMGVEGRWAMSNSVLESFSGEMRKRADYIKQLTQRNAQLRRDQRVVHEEVVEKLNLSANRRKQIKLLQQQNKELKEMATQLTQERAELRKLHQGEQTE